MQASTREPRFTHQTPTPLHLSKNDYKIVCPNCSRVLADNGTALTCPNACAALLRSEYVTTRFLPDRLKTTLARYSQWLPGRTEHLTAQLPLIQKFAWLNALTKLPRLHVALSGRWPRYGSISATGSFKDLEACTVLARLRLSPDSVVVLASAGNTARAFAAEATRQNRRCVIVVTAEIRERLRLPQRLGSNVHCVVVTGPARYDDAIFVSQALAQETPFVLEGGIKNIARRDGVGTVLLAAIENLGCLPSTYLQAVGSAAGAVAVNEMASRALLAGIGPRRPQLVLSQNAPYAPLVRSWNAQSPQLLAEAEDTARRQVAQVCAGVLTNLKPPYSLRGGIYEVLRESDGLMLSVTNAAALAMQERFWQEERVILDPAAAVAAASLFNLPDEVREAEGPLLLHLTGGAPLENTSSFKPTYEYTIAQSDIHREASITELRKQILERL